MTQQLNIRFPDESDILRRLKAVSHKTGFTHRKLIEKWLEAEESGLGGTNTEAVFSETANLTAEIAKLAERVERLESIAGTMQTHSASDDNDDDATDDTQAGVRHRNKVGKNVSGKFSKGLENRVNKRYITRSKITSWR